MLFKRFELGPLGNNCYLFGDEQSNQMVLIDAPIESFGSIRSFLQYKQIPFSSLQSILLTHGHWDHIFEASLFINEWGTPLYVHQEDAPYVTNPPKEYAGIPLNIPAVTNLRYLEDTQIIPIGNTQLEVIATPGHTRGGICLKAQTENILFSGDTLFRMSIGRTDFPGGSFPTLMDSIKNRLLTLNDSMVIYPGHGSESTIGYEKANNSFLNMDAM